MNDMLTPRPLILVNGSCSTSSGICSGRSMRSPSAPPSTDHSCFREIAAPSPGTCLTASCQARITGEEWKPSRRGKRQSPLQESFHLLFLESRRWFRPLEQNLQRQLAYPWIFG